METKIDLMTTLCSAFGVFSAFGVAILAFLTAGGGLGRSDWVAKRENLRLGDPLVWLLAGATGLAVIISGLGLFTSFFWLRAAANGSGPTSRWAYTFADDMFFLEAALVTVITLVAVIGAGINALPYGQRDASNQ